MSRFLWFTVYNDLTHCIEPRQLYKIDRKIQHSKLCKWLPPMHSTTFRHVWITTGISNFNFLQISTLWHTQTDAEEYNGRKKHKLALGTLRQPNC